MEETIINQAINYENQDDKIWTVYMHVNKSNDKRYIGITRLLPEKRWKYKGRGYTEDHQKVFYRAIQKYGWDGFEHIIVAEHLTKDEALSMEIELIALYKTNCNRYKNPTYGYNMTDGGEGGVGRVLSEETRKKMSDSQKRRCKDPKEKERRRKVMLTMLNNPEFKEKMREILKIRNSGENNPMYGIHRFGEDNPNYGHKWSEEMRNKMSERAKNITEEHRRKLSEILKEKYSIPENNPMYNKGKAVVQLTKEGIYIQEYITAAEAFRQTGVSHSHILDCCRGIKQSAGGYMWLFKINYNPQLKYNYKNKHLKQIVQLSKKNNKFIAQYNTIIEASKITGINRQDIGSCCRGKIPSAGGYHWMYLEDYEKLTQQNDL